MFAIKKHSAATRSPSFIDCGTHPRHSLSPLFDDLAARESPAHYAQRMLAMETTVLELLAVAQAGRKTKIDAGLVDTVLQVGDRVLKLLDAPTSAEPAVG